MTQEEPKIPTTEILPSEYFDTNGEKLWRRVEAALEVKDVPGAANYFFEYVLALSNVSRSPLRSSGGRHYIDRFEGFFSTFRAISDSTSIDLHFHPLNLSKRVFDAFEKHDAHKIPAGLIWIEIAKESSNSHNYLKVAWRVFQESYFGWLSKALDHHLFEFSE